MIYFIQQEGGGPIKIGHSRDIKLRLSKLQSGYPYKLTLLGYVRGGCYEEKRLHKVFRKHRLNGEWFLPSRRVLTVISKLIKKFSISKNIDSALQLDVDMVKRIMRTAGIETISELAAKMEISRQGIYYYFRTKTIKAAQAFGRFFKLDPKDLIK